ncbi:BBS9 [Symbiodinium pilosum]|uniref:BBS9 protein n=1 Tax=Symbiodinium pilosum TaxID=2952 RepID=A0A812JW57_SYMPI|nr:BBS9 [Symbiodinium pilosum]
MHEIADRFRAVDANVESRLRAGLQTMGISETLRMYDHHSCHAACSFFGSPVWPTANSRDCCCITLDGRGDCASGKIIKFDEKPVAIDVTSMFDSLGMLWAFVTAALGFKAFRHEGKVTGLAAHGDRTKTQAIFENVMGLHKSEGLWRIRAAWHEEDTKNFLLFLAGLEGSAREKRGLHTFALYQELQQHRPEDVAAGLQSFTEGLLLDYLDLNKFVKPYICVSGGVFANVRLNMRLRQRFPEVKQVFVYPNMGDGGLCFGAAALAAAEAGLQVSCPRGSVFVGPDFSAAELGKVVGHFLSASGGVEVDDLDCFAEEVAAYLANGKVVGLFHGAMEFGPRALGHRSLLACATDPAINSRLNLRLERTEFMPFAPMTLRSCTRLAYVDFPAEDLDAGRHMTMCYEATPALKELCPAIVHLDGTVRPQVVDERDGLAFRILARYEAKTGVHSLINTSFNMHEDPIVCAPEDAVRAFDKGACDVLAAFPFLIHKPVAAAETAASEQRSAQEIQTAEGTFGYMAPESFGRIFTPKSDLYGVGATLLFAATGYEPGALPQKRLKVDFRTSFVGTVWERQESWFLELLEGLMEPAPEDRFSSAAEALDFVRQPRQLQEVLQKELQPSAALAKKKASLDPPRGSKIHVDRKGEELRVLLPPVTWESRIPIGTFGIAWTSFTAVWTAGVISAGASFMALFSLPFWTAGAGMLKDTFGPLLRGAAELRIRRDRWTFGGELGSCGGLPGGFQRGPNWRSERTAAALTDRKPAVPDLQRIAEARTPGCHASMWGSWNRKRCVFTLGSDDLRIYVAYHKPPTVFSLNRVHVRCGRSHVELSRVNWTTKLLRYICCCEPLAVIIKLKRSQVEDVRNILFPQEEEVLVYIGVPLAMFPPEVLHVISEFLVLPTIHDIMRSCRQLRTTLRADSFWQHFYVKVFPAAVRDQVEEFADLGGCSVLDKVAVATLRFCNACHARRLVPGFCSCGARPRFNKFVHFDMRAAEKLRLGLHTLNLHLLVKGFDLQNACLCFSSRYHGNSLASLLRQTAGLGRMQLLACESLSGEVFGAFFGFPLQRRSARAYGAREKLMLFNIRLDGTLRVFEASDCVERETVQSLPDALVIGTSSEAALSLNWDLSVASCASTTLCCGSCLCASEAPLRSVATFSDKRTDQVLDRRISHLTAATVGSDPEVQRNMARQLLQLSGHQDMRQEALPEVEAQWLQALIEEHIRQKDNIDRFTRVSEAARNGSAKPPEPLEIEASDKLAQRKCDAHGLLWMKHPFNHFLVAAREWWSTQVSEDEEQMFDTGCLCLANIDNEYYPKQKEYKIEDLILENNMEAPILQIEAGRFVQGSREICMALLHPMKLSVYMVSAVSSGGSVNYYSMALAYEHKLSRPAFNMCYGCFGGVRDRDYFCVQSLDGVLSFFEQESFAFSRMLTTSFLVPGPICYVPKIDSFVICTNAMCIEAYRYQVLAAAADNVDQSAGEGASGKKVQVDWSTNIGEHARSIEVVRFSRSLSASQQEILVVGEQTIFTLKDSGGIRLQKRLAEYGITASLAYKMPPESPDALPNHNLILGTSTGHCLVLKEMQLVWCARLQGMVPAQICVDTIGGVRGMVVLMDGRGKLQICYLGTDPPTASLVNTEMKELNYDEMEEEHQELLRVIRQTHGDGAAEPEETLVVDSQVPQVLDLGMNEDDCDADDPVGRSDGMVMQLTVHLSVTVGGSKAVENVSITLKAPQCFALSQTSIFIDKVEPGRPPVIIPIVFRVWNKILCSNLEVAVCASYFSLNNEPRTAASSFFLPFALVARPIPPVKNAKHKIQLDCNKQPPQLQTLFGGLLNQPHVSAAVSQGMSNLLSIQYVSGTEATVLVLKSSGRFCVQATEFAALWVLTQELCNRLHEYFGPGGEGAAADDEEPFFITFQDSLPLHDYFALIDDHFDLRRHLDELRKDLADRTQQYRVIQKRLLVRFKDRNPSPLNHLDTLLNLTFEQTLLLTDAIDDVEQALRTVSCHLSAATELVLLLIKFRFGLDEDNSNVLRRHLSPEVCDTTEQGWEEKVDTSLLHLLRTSLARSAKEGNSLPPPMKVPQDTLKLRKRITTVVDRLATGARMTDETAGPDTMAPPEEEMPGEDGE